jgi:hypothetical protein
MSYGYGNKGTYYDDEPWGNTRFGPETIGRASSVGTDTYDKEYINNAREKRRYEVNTYNRNNNTKEKNTKVIWHPRKEVKIKNHTRKEKQLNQKKIKEKQNAIVKNDYNKIKSLILIKYIRYFINYYELAPIYH